MVSMVAIPRPSSPSRHPTASAYSTSADAFARLPSLSLSRSRRIPFRLPSGSTRGTTTQVSPSGACANVRNRSLHGAEVNHFRPVTR